ncbi:MAG: N-acetylmuramoyl-L-alanine amidase [Candidatus Omnitrophica bacterium]|jgi:N-acetylmuramoyl-L-alanine amidase|nr:N-acetylmuramoyl-L-alanine amidase [Candidatus Omnitrophota bacterium]
MKIFFRFILIILLTSCATVPERRAFPPVSTASYINIDDFCKKHGFEYNFDTIDDLLRLYSKSSELKILLNSRVGTLNSSLFYLNSPVVYSKGIIYIPRQLDDFILSGKSVAFRPTFKIKTIIIDPGHGGKDPGAISRDGLMEKTVNLAISRYLKQELEKYGFKVILTRSKDTFISLKGRVDIAKQNNADLFISIHANSNRSRQINGAEIYYLTPSRLDSHERAIRLAATESFQGRRIPQEVKTILWDLLITKNYSTSVEFADTLYYTFNNLGFKIASPKKAPFYVLRFAYVPSILVETGYLSNYYEAKTLRKSYYQKQIAHAITLGVISLQKRYTNLASSK